MNYKGLIIERSGKVYDMFHNHIPLSVNKAGYEYLLIGKKRILLYHIMGQLFCPKYESYNTLDHLDGNRLNSSVSNLIYTSKYLNNLNKTKAKGYEYCKWNKKLRVYIRLYNKRITYCYVEDKALAQQYNRQFRMGIYWRMWNHHLEQIEKNNIISNK